MSTPATSWTLNSTRNNESFINSPLFLHRQDYNQGNNDPLALNINSQEYHRKVNSYAYKNKTQNIYASKFNDPGEPFSSNSYQKRDNKYQPQSQHTSPTKKNKHSDDTYNKIQLDTVTFIFIQILRQKDKRTTIMIRNIPNKYNINSLLNEINHKFMNKFDLLYLPVDYQNSCNLGFGFINFVDPMHIISFYEAYRGKKWIKFNSDKVIESY